MFIAHSQRTTGRHYSCTRPKSNNPKKAEIKQTKRHTLVLGRNQNNKLAKPAVEFSKVFDGRSCDSARVPSTPRRRPATSKAAKRTNAPAKTVTLTRLLNFTAGRRTHAMACAHSELSTGHCGSRIGTKIFQDETCSPSTLPRCKLSCPRRCHMSRRTLDL